MDERATWTTEPQDERDLVLDGPALRALAHPVRVKIVGILRRCGPSTASRLAEGLGLNSGATSYHLRQLADAGLVTEAEDLGNKRDRWWRAVYRSTYFEHSSFDSDPEAAEAYLNAVASAYAEQLIEFAGRITSLPEAWSDGGTMSDFRLRLTAEEAVALQDDLTRVVASYRRDDDVADGTVDAPDGAEVVSVQLHVMPYVGDGR
jgi:DNA-binding transcriptional ArsR family regulator